jgi:rhomboid protease GluP
MEPGLTTIPARSRRQAMDWSLALVSQGIETTIERAPEGGGWQLLIPSRDSEKAFHTLREYRRENRGWPWPESLHWPGGVFDWSCLAWAAVMACFHWLSSAYPAIHRAGVMDTTAVAAGQWWRIFTATMLHADISHLATNLAIGIVLLGLTMARFETGTGMLAAFLAGAGGNVASLMLNTRPFSGLGASGVVMGALGLLTAQSLRRPWRGGSLRPKLGGLAAGIMIFAFYGVAEGTDLVAHFGGFVCGLLLGLILTFAPERLTRSTAFNWLNGVIAVLIAALCWGLALRGLI